MRGLRSTPIPVVVEGIEIGTWPSMDPPDAHGYAVEMLKTAYEVYMSATPFVNFAEGPMDRARRLAKAIIGSRALDLDTVMLQYLRRYGMPGDTRHGLHERT